MRGEVSLAGTSSLGTMRGEERIVAIHAVLVPGADSPDVIQEKNVVPRLSALIRRARCAHQARARLFAVLLA